MNIQGFNNYNKFAMNNYAPQKRIKDETFSSVQTESAASPSFKARGQENRFWEWVGKHVSNIYSKPAYNSEKVQTLCEKLAKMNLGDITTHMTVLGSTITSFMYMFKTWKNDKIEQENKPALIANQGACWALPTVGAYVADSKLKNKIKKWEYRYAGLNDQRNALSNMTKEQLKQAEKDLAFRKGLFRSLASIAVFTTMYRFITPVFVTPITNKVGEYFNNRKKAKAAAQQTALEVEMKTNTENKKLSTAA